MTDGIASGKATRANAVAGPCAFLAAAGALVVTLAGGPRPVVAALSAAAAAAVLAGWRHCRAAQLAAEAAGRALREYEERFGGAFEHASIGMALVAPDGRLLQVNESLARILGRPASELRRLRFQDVTHPDDLACDAEARERMLAGQLASYEVEKRYTRPDGGLVWALLSVSLVHDADGAPLYFVSQVQDITERKRVEGDLRASEQRFRVLAASAPVGICASDPDGACTYVNDYWCRLAGMSRERALGHGWLDAVHPDDRKALRDAMAEAGRTGGELALEHRYLRPDGSVVWLSGRAVPLRAPDGRITGYIGTVADITEAKRAQEQLRELALRDDLTGLANRRRFNEELRAHLVRCARYGWRGALLSLDLDRLKTVNDAFGHAAGDELIRAAAEQLAGRLRASDFLARLGGDEFAILLPVADASAALAVAADLVRSLDGIALTARGSRSGSASVGIALIEDLVTADELLARADVALYEAKQSGGAGVALFAAGGAHAVPAAVGGGGLEPPASRV